MRRTEAFYTIYFINQKDLFATFETWDKQQYSSQKYLKYQAHIS